jgi:threonine/homoserine/homoserine lactone efflux protein
MNVLLTLAAVHLVCMLVPGPNVLAVSQTAVTRSRPAAIAAAMGVPTAALIWAATAQAGLAQLLSSITSLNVVLRTAGATILIVLGTRLITKPNAATPEIPADRDRLGRFCARGHPRQPLQPQVSRLLHKRLHRACPR